MNNVAALEILVGCGYVRAGCLVGVGAAARGMVSGAMLKAVGLNGGMGLLRDVREVVVQGREFLGF